MAVPGQGLRVKPDLASEPALSYEELEKRRSSELTGEPSSPRSGRGLLVLFLAFATLTVYLLIGSYIGVAPVDYTYPEVTGLVAVVSLFGYRLLTRRRVPGKRSIGPVLLDIAVFLGIAGLVVWTFLFPTIYPLPQESTIIGVYSLILIAAMIVVLRFTAPGLRGRSDDSYADIESSLRQLGKAVEQLSRRAPSGEKSADPAVTDRLSAMMGEVAAMKKELSTIKAGGVPVATYTNPSAVRVYAPKAVVSPRDPAAPAEPTVPLTVIKPEGNAKWTAEGGVSVPDSTVDNPWLDVLAKRKAKAQAGSPPG